MVTVKAGTKNTDSTYTYHEEKMPSENKSLIILEIGEYFVLFVTLYLAIWPFIPRSVCILSSRPIYQSSLSSLLRQYRPIKSTIVTDTIRSGESVEQRTRPPGLAFRVALPRRRGTTLARSQDGHVTSGHRPPANHNPGRPPPSPGPRGAGGDSGDSGEGMGTRVASFPSKSITGTAPAPPECE